MSDVEYENLSALIDGELGADQIRFMLRRTDGRVALRATWGRYHIIRDSFRHEISVLADDGFAERVMRGIDGMAVVPDQHRHGRARHWLRWSAGGAIAAGVAVAALIVVQPQMRRAPAMAPGDAPTIAAVKSVKPASPAVQPQAAPAVPRWLSASPPAARMAQAAAADFYGPGRMVQSSSDYAQRLSPYMTLPGPRTPNTRKARRLMYQLWSVAPSRHVSPPRLILRVQSQ